MLRLEPPGSAVLLPGYGPYRDLIDTGLTDNFDEFSGLVVGALWTIGLSTAIVLLFFARTSPARRVARAAKHLRCEILDG